MILERLGKMANHGNIQLDSIAFSSVEAGEEVEGVMFIDLAEPNFSQPSKRRMGHEF